AVLAAVRIAGAQARTGQRAGLRWGEARVTGHTTQRAFSALTATAAAIQELASTTTTTAAGNDSLIVHLNGYAHADAMLTRLAILAAHTATITAAPGDDRSI